LTVPGSEFWRERWRLAGVLCLTKLAGGTPALRGSVKAMFDFVNNFAST